MTVAAACSTASTTTSIGTVADTGFRPASNGLPFANYGPTLADGTAPTNLTAADVRAMFGANEVCADAKAARCDLIPEAQAWLDSANESMAGGHCYGFSVLAELLWEHKVDVAALGAPTAAGLTIDHNQALQRLIAYYWAFQLLSSVGSKTVRGTPNQVLSKLRKVLKPHPTDTYTLTLFKPDFSAGHAVTPYAVENDGGGKFRVFVYDNNWPGATRAIAFDTVADTWTYVAATNPKDPGSTYTGNATTKTLAMFPTSPGLGDQPCPFCGKVPPNPSQSGSVGARGTDEISLTGSDSLHHANLLITDPAGHRLGYVKGKLVDQVHGARVDAIVSGPDWSDEIEPDFVVPAGAAYTITVDGTALTSPDTETLRLVGPSWDVSVDDIRVRPGERDTLLVAPGSTRLSYASSAAESPTIELGVSDTRADYAFAISGVSDHPGSALNVSLPPEGGTLTIDNTGAAGTSTVNVRMTRETAQGTQTFVHDGISLVRGDSAQVRFGSWTVPADAIPLVTVHDGQRSTQMLTDQGG